MRTILLIHNHKTTADSIGKLKSVGFHVKSFVTDEANAPFREMHAAVLDLPIPEVTHWSHKIHAWKHVPLLWWCSEASASPVHSNDSGLFVDGLLTPSMTAQELQWALQLGANHFFQKEQWRAERDQLVSRLEERKWIDIAKGILCEIKQISEAEAYELLRTQAMNERKRMADVAASIVKVYQLLQEQKGGSRK